ncbi:MAG TPA: hypothetical protein PLV45_11350 [bacterium]|nr:hypothetical protein [bacterium]
MDESLMNRGSPMNPRILNTLIVLAGLAAVILGISFATAVRDTENPAARYSHNPADDARRIARNAAALEHYRTESDTDLLDIVNRKLAAEHLDDAVMELTMAEPRHHGGLTCRSATLRLSPVPGTGLSRLLNRMEQIEPRCMIESIRLTRIRSDAGAMDITMELSIFSE